MNLNIDGIDAACAPGVCNYEVFYDPSPRVTTNTFNDQTGELHITLSGAETVTDFQNMTVTLGGRNCL